MICVLSGVSASAREKEVAGGLLISAAGQRDTGEEMCHHPEGADPAGTTSGGDKVGGEQESDSGRSIKYKKKKVLSRSK